MNQDFLQPPAVTSRYRLARAAHIHRARERSARVAWFFIGIITSLCIAAVWVAL